VKDENNLSSPTVYTINKHPELDFTQLEPLFSCVLTESGLALGFRFSTDEAEKAFSVHVAGIQQGTVAPQAETVASKETEKSFLYCLNRVTNLKDDSVRRGAVVKALALCSTNHYIHVYKPLLVLALDVILKSPEREVEVLKELYTALNGVDLTRMPRLNEYQRLVLRNSQKDKQKQEFEISFNFLSAPIKIKIPLTTSPDEVGEQQIIALIQKFQAGIMSIFNAVLSEKRVLFLSDGSTEELCSYVLATVAMMSPLKGLIKRAFPYTNIAGLDFLQVPGYIAGVSNPIFEERTEWWDVLCNVVTGRITVNPQTMLQEKEKTPHSKADLEFFQRVNFSVIGHYGEDNVKMLFESYLQHILDIALEEEEFASESERKTALEANAKRIEMWKKTTSFRAYEQDLKARREASAIKDSKVARFVRKLRVMRDISDSEMLYIYKTFLDNISTEAQLMEFLALLPSSQGGLYPVAVSLFHPSKAVRQATIQLFKRLDSIQTGSGFLNSLNFFLYLAFLRGQQTVL